MYELFALHSLSSRQGKGAWISFSRLQTSLRCGSEVDVEIIDGRIQKGGKRGQVLHCHIGFCKVLTWLVPFGLHIREHSIM